MMMLFLLEERGEQRDTNCYLICAGSIMLQPACVDIVTQVIGELGHHSLAGLTHTCHLSHWRSSLITPLGPPLDHVSPIFCQYVSSKLPSPAPPSLRI